MRRRRVTELGGSMRKYRVMICDHREDVDANSEEEAEAMVLGQIQRGEIELSMISWPANPTMEEKIAHRQEIRERDRL